MECTGKNIIIAGAGKSGIAAANLLAGESDNIILYDGNITIDVNGLRAKLPKLFEVGNKGRIVLGELSEEDIKNADYLVISPGIPTDLDFVKKLKANNVTIWGEAELGYRCAGGRLAAITGTNGKTTTTALLGEIMKTQYESVFVVGNIGIPYTEMAPMITDESVTVAEMSSFQLESIDTFHPQVSMILNITPDHLNRHHTMENYALAKANIMVNQTPDETCVLNYEDQRIRELAKMSKAKVVWFSSARELDEGYFLRGDDIILREGSIDFVVCSIHDMNIIGKHNYENAMAAIAGARALGVNWDNIRTALRSFQAVEHRIEYTATVNGVRYYNDSKGTNPDASIQAVKAMTVPTILIGGGYDKGSEYDEWIESFDGKIKFLLLMGETAEKIADTAKKLGFESCVFVKDMNEAVEFAYEHALPGEAVLLSPCCASWGMFKNYEERGRIFKEIVRALPGAAK